MRSKHFSFPAEIAKVLATCFGDERKENWLKSSLRLHSVLNLINCFISFLICTCFKRLFSLDYRLEHLDPDSMTCRDRAYIQLSHLL